MNIAAVYNAIEARLLADTGAGGLFEEDEYGAREWLVTGVFNNFFSANQKMPFLVFDIADSRNVGAFNTEIAEATIRVSLYISKAPAAMTTASAILDRVYGNAITQSGRVPTFGLNRHVLVLEGGWTGGPIHWLRDTQAHEEDYYHFIQEYSTHLSRGAS